MQRKQFVLVQFMSSEINAYRYAVSMWEGTEALGGGELGVERLCLFDFDAYFL
jgi:hypothetical protein